MVLDGKTCLLREMPDRGRYGPLVPVGDVKALACAIAATLDRHQPPGLKTALAEHTQAERAKRYLDEQAVTSDR